MAYSDWQLQRLRDALAAYHDYGGRDLAQHFNWKDVMEAISLTTGVEVGHERLRQFVEGRGKRRAQREFGSLKQDSLEAVVKFVTEEGLLHPDELREHAPSTQAALRLLEYLDQGFDEHRTLPLLKFEGGYQARGVNERTFIVYELTLQHPSDEGLMQITMTEEVYEAKAKDRHAGWSAQERREHRRSRVVYGGWAIFTPEENVMLFLKEAVNQRNLYQFTLAADLQYRPGGAVEQLVLQRHDYPIELEDTNRAESDTLRSILQQTEKNLLVFRRIA